MRSPTDVWGIALAEVQSFPWWSPARLHVPPNETRIPGPAGFKRTATQTIDASQSRIHGIFCGHFFPTRQAKCNKGSDEVGVAPSSLKRKSNLFKIARDRKTSTFAEPLATVASASDTQAHSVSTARTPPDPSAETGRYQITHDLPFPPFQEHDAQDPSSGYPPSSSC
jgi:hypothetical protein